LALVTRERSGDGIRLAGIGIFTSRAYKPHAGRDPSGRLVPAVDRFLPFYAMERALDQLVNGRPRIAVVPSDDSMLDELGQRILTAFERYDAVTLAGFGTLSVRTDRHGRRVLFRADAALKERMNP
jgi:nucleoid DNA-binding protein